MYTIELCVCVCVIVLYVGMKSFDVGGRVGGCVYVCVSSYIYEIILYVCVCVCMYEIILYQILPTFFSVFVNFFVVSLTPLPSFSVCSQ